MTPLSATNLPAVLPAILAVVLAVFLAGCHAEEKAGGSVDLAAAPPVEAVPARSGKLPLEERLSGVVKASNQVVIRPQIEAAIVEVLVQSGEQVAAGQPLVRLADADLRDQLRQAEAAVRLAEARAREARARVAELNAQVVRWRQLAESDLVSRLDLETLEARLDGAAASADQSDAQVEQAHAEVDEQRTAITEALVRAPVAGFVGRRNAEVGMLVGPSTELFVLGNLERVKVEIPLTEAMLGRLREGMPVKVDADRFDHPLDASLSRISPFLAEGSFSTLGEIDLDNSAGSLRPGMFVTVEVLYGESDEATLVPASAVWEDPRSGELVVFVVDTRGGEPTQDPESFGPETPASPVERRPVEVLAEGRETFGVSGIEPGEWVITVGQQLLEGDDLQARVRATSWDKLLILQDLQQEDLLEEFMAKQQRLAGSIGVVPPSSDAFAAAARTASGGDALPEESSSTKESSLPAANNAGPAD